MAGRKRILTMTAVILFGACASVFGHLCDNVFRQADKLIVKPEIYNITVKDRATFKVFLQNNMDRGIADISLIGESPAFDFQIEPARMPVAKDQRVYFSVTLIPRAGTKTGNYSVDFRLVNPRDGRLFRRFNLSAAGAENGAVGTPETAAVPAPKAPAASSRSEPAKKAGVPAVSLAAGKSAAGFLEIKPVGQPPRIDGLVNDSCWKSASVIANFSSANGGQAVYQTTGLAVFDRDAVYFGFYASDEDCGVLTRDDRLNIQIAFDASGYPFYSFEFSPAGYAYGRKVLGVKSAVPWSAYTGIWKANREKNTWSAEVAVPFVALNRTAPAAREKWYLRIIRVKSTGNAERSFWAPDVSGYNSERFFSQIFLVP